MSVGDNIKKRRFELRMSQQELADAMGYKTRSTIAKIESGENDVSQKKLQKLAVVLDTTPEELIIGHKTSVVTDTKKLNFDDSKGNKNIVIILAGGESGINQQNIPSQFINVNGKPILVYCMEIYQAHPSIDDIYIVCMKGWENIVKAYAKQYGISKLKGIVFAGNSGIVSLKNGLNYMKNIYSEDDMIIIQEATRPMITTEMISRLLQSAEEKGSTTICHSMDDYVQFNIDSGKPKYVDRNSIIALQSPEAHRFFVMNKVFNKANEMGHHLNESCFTMLMYNLGFNINFIESGINNIKITREEDLAAFGTLINNVK